MKARETAKEARGFGSFLKKHRLPVLLILSALIITGVVFLITSDHILHLGYNMLTSPTMLLLNILPVALLLLLVFFISSRLPFAVTVTSAFYIVLAVVHKLKSTLRQEPLLPSDVSLLKEALTIVKTFPLWQVALIALMFLCLAAAVIAAFFLSEKSGLRGRERIIGLIIVLLSGFGANTLWYRSIDLYDSYPVIQSPYFQINQYNSKGLIYSFIHQYDISQVSEPEGYDRAVFDDIESKAEAPSAKSTPHIIMIMGESYSALSENEHIDFSAYRDPMEIFKEMAADENAVYGNIVVSGYGGGTSNTEYDVLTAFSTRFLNSTQPSFNYIHGETDALPSLLKGLGYETLAIHPGYQWFYNRQNVYPDMGFDTCYFLEDSFDLNTQGIGGYINETATMDKIIETLDEHIAAKDTPLFSFTVTIQNHGPYESRFGALDANFDTDIELTDTENDLLTQYFKGIADADEELGRLRDYAQSSDEPIVIVYFGDHLPCFSNGMEFFDILDYPIDANGTLDERLAMYETPYLIWQNDAAAAELALNKESVPYEPYDISSHYLGAMLTEVLGMENISPLYEYVNAARRYMPISTGYIYADESGALTAEPTVEQTDSVAMQRNWQYYRLFDDE